MLQIPKYFDLVLNSHVDNVTYDNLKLTNAKGIGDGERPDGHAQKPDVQYAGRQLWHHGQLQQQEPGAPQVRLWA